jgi:predicted Fe-Mo cluster-binding NifX family protein
MRVAISSEGSGGLDSAVSPHFGRCSHFTLVDLEGADLSEVRAVPNPFVDGHQPGQVPAFMASQGVDVMLSGGMGRRAIEIFEQLGIQAVTGASGSVRQALESYLGGSLQGSDPCLDSGHGD